MVEEYLTDRDQEEALRNWWRENWSWIVGGVVLGLALLAGYQYWKTHSANQAIAASTLYEDVRDALNRNELDTANRLLGTLAADHKSSPYTQQSRMLLAKQHIDAGEYDAALALLRAVVKDSDDDEMAWVARLRMARVLIQQDKHDEALNLLDPRKAGAFGPQVREIRGDAQVAKGNFEAARAEYAAALSDNLADSIGREADRTLLEMKLRDVEGGNKPAASPTEGAPMPDEGQQ